MEMERAIRPTRVENVEVEADPTVLVSTVSGLGAGTIGLMGHVRQHWPSFITGTAPSEHIGLASLQSTAAQGSTGGLQVAQQVSIVGDAASPSEHSSSAASETHMTRAQGSIAGQEGQQSPSFSSGFPPPGHCMSCGLLQRTKLQSIFWQDAQHWSGLLNAVEPGPQFISAGS